MSVGGWRPPEPTSCSSRLGRGAHTASMWGARGLGADGPVWPQRAAPCDSVSSLEGQWPPSRGQGGGRHSEEARLKTPATPRWRGRRASSSEVEDTGEYSPPQTAGPQLPARAPESGAPGPARGAVVLHRPHS